MEELLKQIRKLTDAALRDGLTADVLKRQILQLLSSKKIDASFKKSILAEAAREYDWIKSRIATPETRTMLSDILQQTAQDFAKTKRGLRNDVLTTVIKDLKAGRSSKEIRNGLEAIIGKNRNYASTIQRTAVGAFGRANTVVIAREAGITLLKYSGASAERETCRKYLGQTKTIEEWGKLTNQSGQSILYYCGGFNCRHRLINVVE